MVSYFLCILLKNYFLKSPCPTSKKGNVLPYFIVDLLSHLQFQSTWCEVWGRGQFFLLFFSFAYPTIQYYVLNSLSFSYCSEKFTFVLYYRFLLLDSNFASFLKLLLTLSRGWIAFSNMLLSWWKNQTRSFNR